MMQSPQNIFSLYCLQFINKRCTLLSTLGNFNYSFLENTSSALTQILLFGNMPLSGSGNSKILNATTDFILSTKRFGEQLFLNNKSCICWPQSSNNLASLIIWFKRQIFFLFSMLRPLRFFHDFFYVKNLLFFINPRHPLYILVPGVRLGFLFWLYNVYICI